MTDESTISEDADRTELRQAYEQSESVPSDCWANYGDMDPASHGGEWLHYDDGRWDMRGTFVAERIGFDTDEYDVSHPTHAQYVYSGELHWSDLVTDAGEWTDRAERTLSTLSRAPTTPASAVVDGRLTWVVGAILSERRDAYNRQKPVYTGEYDDILQRVGVDPCSDDGE